MRNLLKLGAMSLATLLLFSLPAFSQQTADVTGTVVDESGSPLPGVVVTAESERLQGARTSVTKGNGSFILRFLPPGAVTLTATMTGMQTQKQTVSLNVGSVARPRIVMKPETTQEVLVVTAEANSVLDTTQTSANMKHDLLVNLPAGKDIVDAVGLAPGVTRSGPSDTPIISGAMSFENSYLLNGGSINADNVRGRAAQLYIEDAVQETTVLTGSVSAEYGQFVGGVINTITKQGSNEFEGSLRVSFENEDWLARTPIELESEEEHEDDITNFQSVTFGGPIVKDRLWFFFAGRRERDKGEATIARGIGVSDAIAQELGLSPGQPGTSGGLIANDVDDDRFEIKLTGTIAQDHTVVVSYLDKDVGELNDTQFGVLTPDSVVKSREIPETLLSVNYRGIITPELSVDATYSERTLEFVRSSDVGTDFVSGSTLEDFNTQGGANYGAHFFGKKPENRDNRSLNIKFSYFLTTGGSGTHDMVFGFSDFMDTRKADNEQAPSGWRNFPSATRFEGDTPIPIFVNGFESPNGLFSGISYWPVLNPSSGSDFTVQSLYFNDSWSLNDKWRFNIGARYDKNDALAQDGSPVADDAMVSPRLSASYDIFGDGRHVLSASYSTYVARLSAAADGATSSGSPALYYWYYQGEQTESMQEVFNWFTDTYGPDFWFPENARVNADFVREPGSSLVIQETLDSPTAEEVRVGYATRIGSKGYFKADYIFRENDDFYAGFTDLTTGPTPDGNNDLQILTNDPGNYDRSYHGVQMQGSWRFNENFTLAGNYTWSQIYGNINGETGGSGSIRTTSLGRYPEYNSFPNRLPHGPLDGDVRHIARLWATYDLDTSFGKFNFAALQRYQSGEKYSAETTIPVSEAYGFPERGSLGYLNPPRTTAYYFLPRGSLEAESWLATDIALNYSLDIKRLEFFLELEIFNLLNSDALVDPTWIDDTVSLLETPFDVFNETPVEDVHFERGSGFGEATGRSAYQDPREFRFSAGFRF